MTDSTSPTDFTSKLKPGVQVRVTQQIPARDYTWTTQVNGTVVRYEQCTTGSWYAHSKTKNSGSTDSSSKNPTGKSPPSTSTNTVTLKSSKFKADHNTSCSTPLAVSH